MRHLNLQYKVKSVAIIDDDPHEVDVTCVTLQDAGFTPIKLSNGFKTEATIAAAVRKSAQAAICDHRLSYHGYAQFYGAGVVARLIQRGTPAILVTQFVNQDSDVSIRKWRRHVPVVLRRDDLDEIHIAAGFESCLKEIKGEYLPGRKPWRSLVRVVDIRDEDKQKVVDVILPSWHPKESVRFPASLLPVAFRKKLKPGLRLMAMVNIGAEKAEDLFFYDFQSAPRSVPEGKFV